MGKKTKAKTPTLPPKAKANNKAVMGDFEFKINNDIKCVAKLCHLNGQAFYDCRPLLKTVRKVFGDDQELAAEIVGTLLGHVIDSTGLPVRYGNDKFAMPQSMEVAA